MATKEDYIIFKKNLDKVRIIMSPKEHLREKQQLLKRILYKYTISSPFVFSYRPGYNLSQCASAHIEQTYIGKLDIKRYFESISWDEFRTQVLPILQDRVDFTGFDTNENVLKLQNLCPPPTNLLLEKKYAEILLYWIKEIAFLTYKDKTFLPQGGITSPWLSNVFLYKIDYQIAWSSWYLGVNYSRYSDNLFFSGSTHRKVKDVMEKTSRILSGVGLKVHKMRIVPNRVQQRILGLVVNKKVNLPKELRKKIRAIKHYLSLGKEVSPSDLGLLSYANMIETTTKVPTSREIISGICVTQKLSR